MKETERRKEKEIKTTREKSMCMEYLGLVLTFELSSELSHVSLPRLGLSQSKKKKTSMRNSNFFHEEE